MADTFRWLGVDWEKSHSNQYRTWTFIGANYNSSRMTIRREARWDGSHQWKVEVRLIVENGEIDRGAVLDMWSEAEDREDALSKIHMMWVKASSSNAQIPEGLLSVFQEDSAFE